MFNTILDLFSGSLSVVVIICCSGIIKIELNRAEFIKNNCAQVLCSFSCEAYQPHNNNKLVSSGSFFNFILFLSFSVSG